MGWIFNRVCHWYRLLRRAVWPMFAIPLALLVNLFALRDEFLSPSVAAKLKLPEFLPEFPWYYWTIILLLLIIVALLEGAYREHVELKKEMSTGGAGSKKPKYLKEAFVYSGSTELSLLPRYWAKLAENVKQASIYIDHQHFVGSSWTQRTCLPICNLLQSLAREQSIDLVLLTSFDRNGARSWRWGNAAEATDIKYHFDHRAMHRGRVVFMAPDGSEEYCYFIVQRLAHDEKLPNVVGQFNFQFVADWEAEA